MLAHHLVHHLMGGKRDPGVFQLVYFVLMHELFMNWILYIYMYMYPVCFFCVLVRVKMLFSKKKMYWKTVSPCLLGRRGLEVVYQSGSHESTNMI